MRQVSKAEAIRIFKSELWKDWDDRQKVQFQLFQDRLCMPFDKFHEAITNVLGRSVYTHEFGANRGGLQKEFLGEVGPPTLDEILDLIPNKNLFVLILGDNED